MKKMKCLVSINLYKLTGDEIGELKQMQISSKHAYKFLPEYCLRTDTNKIDYSEYYLQFTNSGKEEFILFDIEHIEQPLAEEISSGGIQDVLNFDFSFLKELKQITYQEMSRTLHRSTQIVFDLEYNGEGEDVDLETTLYGYLNAEKEIKKYEQDTV